MKKFIFSAAIALAAIGGISAYNGARSTAEPLNDLALANVAALTSGESSTQKNCFRTVTEAPDDGSLAVGVVACSSCSDIWATNASDPGTCQ